MSCVSRMAALAIPAVRQILARLAKGDKEEEEFVEKIENSCLKFDHDKKGMLTPDEYFNVMKLQNGVDCTKEEVNSANHTSTKFLNPSRCAQYAALCLVTRRGRSRSEISSTSTFTGNVLIFLFVIS